MQHYTLKCIQKSSVPGRFKVWIAIWASVYSNWWKEYIYVRNMKNTHLWYYVFGREVFLQPILCMLFHIKHWGVSLRDKLAEGLSQGFESFRWVLHAMLVEHYRWQGRISVLTFNKNTSSTDSNIYTHTQSSVVVLIGCVCVCICVPI